MLHVRRRLAGAALLLLPLALAGCLDYAEEMRLNPDGSGTLRLDFTIDMDYMAQISHALGEEPNEEELRGPTEEEIMEGLEVEGIRVEDLEIEERDRKSRVRLTIHFEDLEALNRIEGFGDDRRIEFYDDDGKIRVVYGFDTKDVLPAEDVDDEDIEQATDPIERKILEITREARDAMKFRARIVMPGPVLMSNGARDRSDPNASIWRIDQETDPEKHDRLGKGKIVMMLRVDRESLPFLTPSMIRPLPEDAPGAGD